MNTLLETQLKCAKESARLLNNMPTCTKNQALDKIADALIVHSEEILEANKKDMAHAKEVNMTKAMQDRLLFTYERIVGVSDGVKKVATLPDPIGEVMESWTRPNGLEISKVRVPIGVFGIIYEARPNVTVDIASLCLKSGNACVLRGGKEAIYTNKKLVEIMKAATKDILPEGAIELITELDHAIVGELIHANEYVDVIVPRGGAGLIQFVVKNATVPVIETGAGICHLYVDKDADLNKALTIAVNAKIQRPSVCNAIETILVHKDVADKFLPELKKAFEKVEIKGDDATCQIINCEHVTDDSYATEYDDYIVNIRVVDSVEEAINHIYTYSTKHSESIITENNETAALFMNSLDSACVY
uniref:glutamate-5-semialdehyde dehydrogenase n=1 Tax=Catenibacterium sp. TaxID=2049022 RepID=UPI003AB299DC